MEDKSFFSIFQTLFFLTGIPFALILWGMLDLPWHRAVIVAITAGIIIGIPLGWFMRGTEVNFASDPNTNLGLDIAAALIDMGYRKEYTFNKTTVFKPTWRAGVFGDNFIVNEDHFDFMVCGPKAHVDEVLKRIGV